MEDPNEAIRPDFTSPEHQEEHQALINKGLLDQQAACSLAAIWDVNNNTDKEHWALRQLHLQDVRQREEEEEEQHQQLLKDEQEAACHEERKKNKNKYAPLLHYFTNRGLEDAKTSNLLAELDALVMLLSADGLHLWIPAAAVKDPKAAPITKDENLSWEDFNEAIPRMISLMKVHDWPDDRVHMHIHFWCVLQVHRWCHAPDPLKQKALLLYQSQQHCSNAQSSPNLTILH
ncbi:hypothetical protein F4604DRAFT_1882294 [Suillus subluteus]|nr:hypothetical protein F4604DRAFT_1882294 [Suillus subluteus]